jgi:predicted RNA-binding protein with TRAM domain
MPDCPLAGECPNYTERIEGMGCQHYGERGGAEWCNHYHQPIRELKSQPVKPGEEIVIEITDIHESGAGVGRTDDGFIVLVDGVLPDARARVRVTTVRSNHARAEELERLPMEDEEGDSDADRNADRDTESEREESDDERPLHRQRLGSRDNFWGS